MADQNSKSWKILALRTTFFTEQIIKNAGKIWKDVVGSEPDEVSSKPKIGKTVLSGKIDKKLLSCHVEKKRMDWYANPDEDEIEPGMNTIGYFPDDIDYFKEISQKTIAHLNGIKRIAFGPLLIKSVSDKIEGYNELQNYLHDININPKNTTDFIYQINRKRTIKLNDKSIEINRLCKWLVMTLTTRNIEIQDLTIDSEDSDDNESYFGTRVNMDINNAPGHLLSDEESRQLLNSLIDIGIEISESGDVE